MTGGSRAAGVSARSGRELAASRPPSPLALTAAAGSFLLRNPPLSLPTLARLPTPPPPARNPAAGSSAGPATKGTRRRLLVEGAGPPAAAGVPGAGTEAEPVTSGAAVPASIPGNTRGGGGGSSRRQPQRLAKTMIASLVCIREGDQRRQPPEKVQRLQHQVGVPLRVGPRAAQLVQHLPVRPLGEPFLGEGRAQAVTQQALQSLPVMRGRDLRGAGPGSPGLGWFWQGTCSAGQR
jgi:hypothetical protein